MFESNSVTDSELISLFKNDSNEVAFSILVKKYKPLIISRIKYYGFNSSDVDDLLQECLIGLYTAINNYNQEKSAFSTFSRVCIDRMLISELRKRGKSVTDNISIDDVVIKDNNTPQEILEQIENYDNLISIIKSKLSKLEYSVLVESINGKSYSEISNSLGISQKSVDNAVQRIRTKFSNISPM